MPGIYRNIPIHRLDIPRSIHHFGVRIARHIALHPQAVTGQNIAVVIADGIGQQIHIVARIQQGGIENTAGGIEGQ
ncbi:hypothetical protein SRABI106_01673 [Rahnella aquatilis]|nr:hypothetical protein SRABI106_01673 [Rahnella aquatilis]